MTLTAGRRPCPGPLVWFDVPQTDRFAPAALLLCADPCCDYVAVDAAESDTAHRYTPLLREGVA